MARKKKGNDALGGFVVVVLGFIIWLISIVIEGIVYVHEKMVEFSSSPVGLTILFFILLILMSFLVKVYLRRGVRKDEAQLLQERDDFQVYCQERTEVFMQQVAKKELDLQTEGNNIKVRSDELSTRIRHFEAEVKTKVQAGIKSEKAEMDTYLAQHTKDMQKANSRFQRLIDTSYTFKVKTFINGVTLKNQQTRWTQLKKEAERYIDIQADIKALTLDDNSDWDGVVIQFKDRIALLEKAQEEKEAQAELKRQMREEKQRQDELERRQREAEEEEIRLAEQQRLINEALAQAEGQHRNELEKQKADLEQQIANVHSQYERAKSMAQLTKQGHVYVISNIGSFGEEVFKVGMTRRLEPMDRVKELGDASVPFEFDVHAMISCDDAPALENALHTELNQYRMNKINLRKEFFKVDLQQIIDAVERNHGTVEYVADPLALQYYRSLAMDTEEVAA